MLLCPLAAFPQSPYDEVLIEQYIEQENFLKALHLTRINYGLDHPGQIPIIRELLDRDEDFYSLLYNVTTKHYGYGSSEAVLAVEEATRYYVNKNNLVSMRYYSAICKGILANAQLSDRDKGKLYLSRASIEYVFVGYYYGLSLADYQGDVYQKSDNKRRIVGAHKLSLFSLLKKAKGVIAIDQIPEYNRLVDSYNNQDS